MDNKRKISGPLFGKGAGKLRKVSLNAFDDEPDTDVGRVADSSISTVAASQLPATTNTLIDPEQIEVISKTALWMTNNPDKASALIEKSRGNPTLEFLNDTSGTTAAGKLYLKELQKYKTEKEVQSVCSGMQDAPVVHASQIANFIAMNRQADFGAMMANSGYTTQALHPTPTSIPAAPSNNSVMAATVAAAAPREREREKRNRWGPSVVDLAPALPNAPYLASTGPVSSTSSGIPQSHSFSHTAAQQGSSSNSSSSGVLRPKDFSRHGKGGEADDSEAYKIAQLSANFDSFAPEDTERIEKLLREQREMQLLESRIREAASQSIGGAGNGSRDVTEVAKFLAQNADKSSSSGSSAHNSDTADPYAVNLQARKGPALLIAEKQAALYLERLAQYQELAALDDDKYRDTVEDCERSGGVIEGGTWEHRKRAKEMLNTAAKNLELTLLGAGKHHMADYLPPDVLQSFLKNAENVKSGTSAVDSSGANDRISESNVGFQLLKKSGWSEGAGLGAQSNGIVNPISVLGSNVVMSSSSGAAGSVVGGGGGGVGGSAGGSVGSGGGSGGAGVVIAGGRGPEGAGIGVRATHEVTAEDSEFDQYRKRMMLAYRFRPNPLNNPRRNYY